MKITKIRDIDGKKLSQEKLEAILRDILVSLEVKGYLHNTYGEILNSQSIKIAGQGRSFSIDVKKLGYNAQYNPYANLKSGFRCTNLPTWDQRVDFNNTVNEVLNMHNISATVKSGVYLIREGLKSLTERDWHIQMPEHQRIAKSRGFYIDKLEQ